jgi:hypothetical protein
MISTSHFCDTKKYVTSKNAVIRTPSGEQGVGACADFKETLA